MLAGRIGDDLGGSELALANRWVPSASLVTTPFRRPHGGRGCRGAENHQRLGADDRSGAFRALQARQGLLAGDDRILERLFPAHRAAPIVTVLDGHPHTLSFLAAINRTGIACLGVSGFGQSRDVPDLYRHFGIDTETIIGAAWDLIDGS